MITPSDSEAIVLAEIERLQSLADNLKAVSQSGKIVGSVAVGAGLAGLLLATPPTAAAAIAIGVGHYVFRVMADAQRTGRISPLPWSDTSLKEVIESAVYDNRKLISPLARLEPDEYLPAPDEAFLFLLTNHKEQVIELLDRCGTDKGATLKLLAARFYSHYRRVEMNKPGHTTLQVLDSVGWGDFFKALPPSQPTGQLSQSTGQLDQPTGQVSQPTGQVNQPTGQVNQPTGQVNQPTGQVNQPTGQLSHVVTKVRPGADGHSPVDAMAKPIRNTVIVGQGGAGKGLLVSNALRKVVSENPDTRVMVIDPKCDPLEAGYWKIPGVEYRGVDCRNEFRGKDKSCRNWLQDQLDEFHYWEGRKLLVVDEIRFLVTTLNRIKSVDALWADIQNYVTLGDGEGHKVWLVSQSPNLSDLGTNSGGIAQFYRLALVSDRSIGFYHAIQGTKMVGPAIERDIEQLVKDSPVKRAYFDSDLNDWVSMARLTNYSSRDRDNGVVSQPTNQANQANQANQVNRVNQVDQVNRLVTGSAKSSDSIKYDAAIAAHAKVLLKYANTTGRTPEYDYMRLSKEAQSSLAPFYLEGILATPTQPGKVSVTINKEKLMEFMQREKIQIQD